MKAADKKALADAYALWFNADHAQREYNPTYQRAYQKGKVTEAMLERKRELSKEVRARYNALRWLTVSLGLVTEQLSASQMLVIAATKKAIGA